MAVTAELKLGGAASYAISSTRFHGVSTRAFVNIDEVKP
jgi:hypothetical protein